MKRPVFSSTGADGLLVLNRNRIEYCQPKSHSSSSSTPIIIAGTAGRVAILQQVGVPIPNRRSRTDLEPSESERERNPCVAEGNGPCDYATSKSPSRLILFSNNAQAALASALHRNDTVTKNSRPGSRNHSKASDHRTRQAKYACAIITLVSQPRTSSSRPRHLLLRPIRRFR